MPEPIDLSGVRAARDELTERRVRAATLRAQIAEAARARDVLVASGARPERIAQADARVEHLTGDLTVAGRTVSDRTRALDTAADALLAGASDRDPIASMDGRIPMVLLPVRIETRFSPDATKLRIRIFPDDVHVDSHVRGLTQAEIDVGRWYWEQRWADPDDRAHADAAWARLIERIRPARARYAVEVLRPPGPIGGRSGPTFPDLEPRPPGPGRPPIAAALPERWAAIGYRPLGVTGRMTEVFRVWSSRVPDDVPVAPDMDIGAEADAEGDDGLDWMRDPATALAMGLMVEVTDDDLPTGLRLADGVERLVVVGADWTRTPEESAAELDRLFDAHRAAGHLELLRFGTPTNHTGGAGELPPPPEIVPVDDPVELTEHAGSSRLISALGVSGSALRDIPGSTHEEHRWASALVDATWEATAGHFLGELMDPIVSDAHIERLRAHAAQYLQPSGPLPLLRIDRQPYGVLPVVASARLDVERDATLQGLRRTLDTLRRTVAPGLRDVPRLGAAARRDDLADVLVELLQRTPVAWTLKVRTMLDPVTRFIAQHDWTTRIELQRRVRDVVLAEIGVEASTRLDEFVIDTRARPVNLPLVRKGDAGASYLAELAAAVRADDADRQLRLRQSSVTVLEALLAFAGAQEVERAATDALRDHLVADNTSGRHDTAIAKLAKRGVRTPALLRVDERAADQRRNQVVVEFASGRELSARVIPEFTGTTTVGQTIARRLRQLVDDGRLGAVIATRDDPYRQLARYATALDTLTAAPLDELEWAFRGTLDCFASRIDAWETSLASMRLAGHRAAAPTGAHLGCFGWVEDLRPDAGGPPESLGYVHSPSIAHATACAILRAGRHASEDNTFDLEITSRRVREAERLLDGLGTGRSLAALLGSRLERALRDSVVLGRYILPLRGVASVATPVPDGGDAATGASGDIVDGVAVLERWRNDPDAVFDGADVVHADRAALRAVLTEVDAVFDAVSDVLVAEAIFQISSGNIDRAGAAMRSHDHPRQPMRLEFVRTPPSGTTITHRVVVATTTTSAPGWPTDLRHRAEPRLGAWLGTMIGRADKIDLGATISQPGGATRTTTVRLSELGLGPVSVVLAMQQTAERASTALEQMVARHLAMAAGVDESAVDVGDATFDRLRAVCGWAHQLLGCEPLSAAHLDPDDVTGHLGVDLDELERRVRAVGDELDDVRVRLADLARRIENGPQPTATQVASQLERAAVFEPQHAAPVVPTTHPDARSRLAEQVEPIVGALTARRARADEELDRLDDDADDDRRASRLVAAMRQLLGATQPVLPVFRLPRTDHLDGAIAARTELLDGDDTAPLAWIHKMALVRPGLDPFAGLLLHAEADRADLAAQISVTQWPLQRTPRWFALPNGPDGPPPDGSTSVTGHFKRAVLTRKMAGIVVDSWSETIPATEATTGLSFHYDAPGARAPQSILVAVHPDETPDAWNTDLLVETVNEAIDLTHLRGAGPRELGPLAGVLPMIVAPELSSREVPTIPIKQMSERAAAAGGVASDVLGRD